MSGHAPLAPSAAARWVVCALSPTLEAAYPEQEDSPASMEGTAAHWVVEMRLQGTPVALGDRHANGVAVTGEMLEGAEMVLDDIIDKLGPNWADVLVIEKPVQIPRVHPTANWGTPDYRARATSKGRPCLFIWDYKFGHGLVEAPENWQLTDYASGCLDEWGVDGVRDQEVIVDFGIIQPRAHHRDGPVRHWRTMASDLRAAFNRLANAARVATAPNPPATPDPDACEYCAGRHACEALQRAAYVAADHGGRFGALDLSPDALGLELRTLTRAQALLKARVSGLEAQAAAIIKQGKRVPFWMMETTAGRLAWTKPTAEVLMLGQMLGKDFAKPLEPITPAQAKKLGLPDALAKSYAARPAGSVKLVPDDGSKARLTFSSSVT